MRTDAGKTKVNRKALAQMARRTIDEERAGASLSGHERNRLFISSEGKQFTDVSGVSGLDDPGDGRAFAVLDYDRDGWPDVATVNANAPWLQLFRNEIESVSGDGGRMVALRFVGGNDTDRPSASWSARDGFGATVTLDVGGRRILREHRAGEGMAAQNSATLIVGLGETEQARALSVRWPSGRRHTTDHADAGTLLTVYENADQSPTGEAFVRSPYRRTATTETVAPIARKRRRVGLRVKPDEAPSRLRLYTTMATWCVACLSELPQLRRLRSAFSRKELAMVGVPIDPGEGVEKIEAWRVANEPVYELRTDWDLEEIQRVKNLALDELKTDAVPASVITDGDGRILWIQWGPPSMSKTRELLRGQPCKD